VELIEPPRVVKRYETKYVGIRVVTPFRGMLRVHDELLTELNDWLRSRGIEAGPFFLRLNVIDMDGPMDLEVGAVTKDAPAGDERVTQAVLPAGDYATLTYRDHAIRANRALIEWAAANEVRFDSQVEPDGDRFACRYEAYLTDPFTERRKTKWEVELNIRVAD
jgi:effector-binding domain-containing protein